MPGVLLIISSVMLIAPSASAEAKPTSPSGKYCAFNSATAVMACVDEEKDYPVAKAAALGNGGASAMRAQYLLGRFFDNAGFNTSSGFIDWFGTSSCTSSLSDTNSSWSDTTSWRDRISSFQGYSACRIRAYENASYAEPPSDTSPQAPTSAFSTITFGPYASAN